MSWAITLLAGILGLITGAMGMFAIGLGCVKWYHITSFEGASGYFVVGLSLLGAIVGFLLAMIAARIACSLWGPLWYHQLGGAALSILTALTIVLIVAYAGRK